MDRVAIVGCSGSGKSALAHYRAERLGLVHIELDALFHQPDWTPTPTPEFRTKVTGALETPRWVVDGNYMMVSDLVQAGADTIVVLDLGRVRTTGRVVRRSVVRSLRREHLWGTNYESWRRLVSRDPEESIVMWTWTQHPKYRARYRRMITDGSWAHATVHHLTKPREVRRFRRAAGETRLSA